MAIRFPGFIHAKQILRRTNLFAKQAFGDVPKGYFAVYVGETQRKRYIVPVSFLNQSSFQDLLRKTEDEFGFSHPAGGLTIPCRQDIFTDIISSMKGL